MGPNLAQRRKFGTEMAIQHRKLIDAKFCQYACHVSNEQVQHKMVWESKIAIEFDGILLVYGSSHYLFESNWNYDLSDLL